MKKTIIIVLIILGLAILPLLLNAGAEFGGADGMAEEVIMDIRPEYSPWFNSLMEPASGEIESLLFTLQATLGAGLIGYYLGVKKGKLSAKS